MPDMYLEVDGIPGESVSDQATGQIDINGWDINVSNGGTMHTGGGGGAGAASHGDVSIQKNMDKSSTALFKACATGTHIPHATIRMYKSGGEQLMYASIKMENILITSVNVGGSSGSDTMSENLTMNFSSYEYVYKPQNTDGTLAVQTELKYNIQGKRLK
jgi:type VI secretion system secreted protein Hcp